MSIHFQINIDGDTADEAIAEFRNVFGALVGAASAGVGAPAGVTSPMVSGPQESNTESAPRKTRARKDKGETGEAAKTDPLPDASNAEKTESASTSSTTEPSSTSASDVSSVSIDDLRAKLMSLSKTDGGHDKVFTILGKFGAKNASTVPEDKRGEVVALVDEALAGAK